MTDTPDDDRERTAAPRVRLTGHEDIGAHLHIEAEGLDDAAVTHLFRDIVDVVTDHAAARMDADAEAIVTREVSDGD